MTGLRPKGGARMIRTPSNGFGGRRMLSHLERTARVAAASLLLAAGPACSQAADPPYEAQMQRLAEILGSLHYLRPLCGSDEGSLWRDQMNAMLDAEAPTPDRKAKLVTAFNQGYSSFASTYRACTQAAAEAVDRFTAEGSKLTHDIATRYGR